MRRARDVALAADRREGLVRDLGRKGRAVKGLLDDVRIGFRKHRDPVRRMPETAEKRGHEGDFLVQCMKLDRLARIDQHRDRTKAGGECGRHQVVTDARCRMQLHGDDIGRQATPVRGPWR